MIDHPDSTQGSDPMTTFDTATSLVAGRDGIGVSQRRKVFEMRNQYTLSGDDGTPIGAVEQIGQSAFTFLARLFSDLDVSLPVTLAVTGNGGELAMRLHKPWFRFRVTVTGADGSVLGHVRKRVRLGKAVFAVTDGAGVSIGRLLSENWRSRNFRLENDSGQEVARVTKKWRGLLTEIITDADSYAVTFEPRTENTVRMLAIAAALAVDLTMKQKDYGSPLDLIDF
jgi:uncharacterized protein YxjI